MCMCPVAIAGLHSWVENAHTHSVYSVGNICMVLKYASDTRYMSSGGTGIYSKSCVIDVPGEICRMHTLLGV